MISKQVLLSSLQADGFDAHLIDLINGDYQEEYGKVIYKDTEFTKVYFGRKIDDIEPSAYDVWGVTNNFSQLREIAGITIKHLNSKGKPVVVGGSDAIAEPRFYISMGADAVVLDKSGAANSPIMRPLRDDIFSNS
uniref:Uncharacterized protein n=1 Tax=Candidatus Kentrum sp. UNK TaxID=2126344 RepID=A0A451ATD1_9GAMM|nr:MAG: hypothetical protein BECKUNK1418G_GA0071005_13601 [Candidatus Kentron sp. UNK]VFK73883.1 MAG: hypothetical protein BECKUNK1418H_GA0071006_13421 [Candidatus Kentron sp. UNK]